MQKRSLLAAVAGAWAGYALVSLTADQYARDLLAELGREAALTGMADARTESTLWAESGARFLTGEYGGAALPSPAPLATAARGAWLALAALGEGALDPDFPAHQLLGERAALLGLERRGAVSPGGACRLLECADGLLALNLPREDDWRLLPAWLERGADTWETVARVLRERPCAALVARARLLGLAAAVSRLPGEAGPWFHSHRLCPGNRAPDRPPVVVDLSAIWAGPLCAQLLGDMGARVIKVESRSRPDGARAGPAPFFDLLNGGKESVVLDLESSTGREQLRCLLAGADIVIESARPRGLEQMGIRATDIVAERPGRTWLAITGYGREAPRGEWIAYGDDAGVAAGLSAKLADSTGRSVFCGDAIADPLTGLHAALLAWHAWTGGGGVLLDVSLAGVVGRCIAADNSPHDTGTCAGILPPCARPALRRAAPAGRDTAAVLSGFGAPT